MYVEDKSGGVHGGWARIARVYYSASGRTLEYRGRKFIPYQGYKSNYLEAETNVQFWISGPKKRGGDRLSGTGKVEIDEDVREEYWAHIRGEPHRSLETSYRD